MLQPFIGMLGTIIDQRENPGTHAMVACAEAKLGPTQRSAGQRGPPVPWRKVTSAFLSWTNEQAGIQGSGDMGGAPFPISNSVKVHQTGESSTVSLVLPVTLVGFPDSGGSEQGSAFELLDRAASPLVGNLNQALSLV